MAPHSNTLAWKIPWTEEPCRLQSMGSQRVGHNWATSLLLFTFMHWRRKWQPTPVFLPEEIPGTGEPGGLPCMGSHRVGHDWSDLAAVAVRKARVINSLSLILSAYTLVFYFTEKITNSFKKCLFSTSGSACCHLLFLHSPSNLYSLDPWAHLFLLPWEFLPSFHFL